MKKKTNIVLLSIFAFLFVLSCTSTKKVASDSSSKKIAKPNHLEKAVFAGGCFWCVEAGFEKAEGIYEAISGYTGDTQKSANYPAVSGHKTKHFEAVEVYYDPDVITYKEVLEVFWRGFNPTDNKGQFADRGHQYQPAIFYQTLDQKRIAMESRSRLEKSKRFSKPINTPILKAQKFYPAEDYHQDYYKKSPIRYQAYFRGSGRKGFIEKYWGNDKYFSPSKKSKRSQSHTHNFTKPSDEQIKKKLTSVQYRVTQENGTERPFQNEFWDSKKEGIYVDIVSGEPLFSSTHKFKSGTGWPSFSQPLDSKYVVDIVDNTFGMTRTEVRSKIANSHLGHVFSDGPQPTGLRYCINSASLRFIPRVKLADTPYKNYLKLFK